MLARTIMIMALFLTVDSISNAAPGYACEVYAAGRSGPILQVTVPWDGESGIESTYSIYGHEYRFRVSRLAQGVIMDIVRLENPFLMKVADSAYLAPDQDAYMLGIANVQIDPDGRDLRSISWICKR